jgi:predicted nucleotidyltransferase
LRSSVLVWPRLRDVDRAARDWATRQAETRPGTRAIGYFGSYARCNPGPGSDLDLVVIVADSDRPFIERAVEWDLQGLPVPADLLVYTADEWHRLQSGGGRLARVLAKETVWVLGAPSGPAEVTSSA